MFQGRRGKSSAKRRSPIETKYGGGKTKKTEKELFEKKKMQDIGGTRSRP